MKIIFNKNDYNSYKDFYIDVLNKLNAKRFVDWKDEKDLGYNGNLLWEFLWYCSKDGNHYIFKNFNRNKTSTKSYEDNQWEIIFFYFEKLVKKYPKNTLTFVD